MNSVYVLKDWDGNILGVFANMAALSTGADLWIKDGLTSGLDSILFYEIHDVVTSPEAEIIDYLDWFYVYIPRAKYQTATARQIDKDEVYPNKIFCGFNLLRIPDWMEISKQAEKRVAVRKSK
jgi:hypothetical protein